MRFTEVQDALRRVPFSPFRIHLTNGQSYEIRHPEFAGLTRHSVFVGVAEQDDIPERMVQCDLLHVVTIEPVNGAHNSSSR